MEVRLGEWDRATKPLDVLGRFLFQDIGHVIGRDDADQPLFVIVTGRAKWRSAESAQPVPGRRRHGPGSVPGTSDRRRWRPAG